LSIRRLFGLKKDVALETSTRPETETVRKITAALDELEPERARIIACFAYILSRVAHADQSVSPEESRVIEQIVMEQGRLPEAQAVIVVQMAKTQSTLFGGIEDYVVTREFNKIATLEQKTALLDCLFAVAAANKSISTVEDNEIRQIAAELKLRHDQFIGVRLKYRSHLDVLKE
jgi:uncharacterized tellurite resistance protein B-like protein